MKVIPRRSNTIVPPKDTIDLHVIYTDLDDVEPLTGDDAYVVTVHDARCGVEVEEGKDDDGE